jgi:hypothetical protein
MLIFHLGEAEETLGLTVIDPIVVLKGGQPGSEFRPGSHEWQHFQDSHIRSLPLLDFPSKTFEGLVWFLIQIQYTYIHICTHTIYMFCSPLGPTSSLPHSPLVLTISEVP